MGESEENLKNTIGVPERTVYLGGTMMGDLRITRWGPESAHPGPGIQQASPTTRETWKGMQDGTITGHLGFVRGEDVEAALGHSIPSEIPRKPRPLG